MDYKKNRKIFIVLPLLFVFIVIVFGFSLYKNNKINLQVEELKSMSIDNIDINICKNQNIKALQKVCFDNYYSLKAFRDLDDSICNKIKNKELEYACMRNVVNFLAKRDADNTSCTKLKENDISICNEFVQLEKDSSLGKINCGIFKNNIVRYECQKYIK